MPDIIVTTPKTQIANAEQEALDCIAAGGGSYFRVLHNQPDIKVGERVWYVENGYLRGFAEVTEIVYGHALRTCDTTGRVWNCRVGGCVLIMDAATWKWLQPTYAISGFQGWQYRGEKGSGLPIVGGWLDPKPNPERWAGLKAYLGREV